MSATLVNPPFTPARGVTVRPSPLRPLSAPAHEHPLVARCHHLYCRVCLPDVTDQVAWDKAAEDFVEEVADAVAHELDVLVEAEARAVDPNLTAGQRRLLQAEQARLFRMLDDRRPGRLEAVLVLLDDLAQQAPAVDDVLESERQRRRDTAAARPTIALALVSNRPGGAR